VFNTEEATLSSGTLYALYAPDGQWSDGVSVAWIDALPKTPGEIRYFRQPEGRWRVYDMELYLDGHYAGYARLLYEPNQFITPIDEIKYISLYLYFMLFSLVIALIGGLWIAGRALKSLKGITATAVEIGSGNLSKRINWTGSRDEIGTLANTFDNMADSLQKSFQREKQFTSDVSHEIRTPVTSIIVNAENAEYCDEIETYRTSIKNILAKGRQLQSVINQLLMLARESEQGDQLIIEEIALHIVLEDIADEARELAKEKEITVETDIAPNLTLQADLTLFTRLMINLVSNAIKYGKDGGYVKIIAHAPANSNAVQIQICDNGLGISEDDIHYIFQRFYRADKSRADGSAGLGLSFSEMITHMHNGKIWVESKLGQGSCFFIELPAKHAS
jgi:signal transduction histidine kinase